MTESLTAKLGEIKDKASAADVSKAVEPLVAALTKINGDLSDGHKKLRAALASTELDAPNGKIKLDANRHATGNNFITEVVEAPNGDLTNKMVKVIPNVNQTLGMTTAQFKALGLPARDAVDCAKLRAGG